MTSYKRSKGSQLVIHRISCCFRDSKCILEYYWRWIRVRHAKDGPKESFCWNLISVHLTLITSLLCNIVICVFSIKIMPFPPSTECTLHKSSDTMQAFLLPQHKYRIMLLHVAGEDNSESAEITHKNAFLSLIIMMKMKGNRSLIISECVQNVENIETSLCYQNIILNIFWYYEATVSLQLLQ